MGNEFRNILLLSLRMWIYIEKCLYNFIFYKNILMIYKKIEIFRKQSYNSDINALQNERDLESILCLSQEVQVETNQEDESDLENNVQDSNCKIDAA